MNLVFTHNSLDNLESEIVSGNTSCPVCESSPHRREIRHTSTQLVASPQQLCCEEVHNDGLTSLTRATSDSKTSCAEVCHDDDSENDDTSSDGVRSALHEEFSDQHMAEPPPTWRGMVSLPPQNGDNQDTEGELESIVSDQLDGSYIFSCLEEVFKDAKGVPGLNVSDNFSKHLEMVVALITNLARADHWDSVISALTLYFNNFTKYSVTGTCLKYMDELFKFSPQSQEEGTDTLPVFIRMMRMARDNFTLLKNNPMFGHFSKFLGLIVAVGLCETSQVSFNLGKYKLFEPCMKTAHGSAENILEALFNSVTFFIERIYFCFKNRSLKPLLISDSEAADMDEELAQLTLFWALHRNGNLYDVKKIHAHEFERRLNTLGTKLKNLLACKTGIEKQIIKDKYVKVLSMIGDLVLMDTNGGIREAPFHIQLYGDSGVGKSTATTQLCNSLLASAGLPLDEGYRCAINADDKFMSNWTSDKLVMILDDFGNTRPDKMPEPPTKFIILAKNNAPAYAPKAEVEAKGKCAIKPKLMFTTTNVKDLAAAKYSVNPFSIQNRSDYVLVLKNRKECLKSFNGSFTLDRRKCDEWHKNNKLSNKIVEDVWLVTIQKPLRPKDESHLAKYQTVKDEKGKLLKDISMSEAAQFLCRKYELFREDQAAIIQKSKDQAEVDYTLCEADGCSIPALLCTKHKQTKMKEQSGELGDKLKSAIDNIADKTTKAVTNQVTWLAFNAESVTTIGLITASRLFSNYFDWMVLMPEPWVRSDFFMSLVMLFNKEQIAKKYVTHSIINWIPCVIMAILGRFYDHLLFIPAIIYGLFAAFRQMGMVVAVKDAYRKDIFRRNNAIASCVKEYRDNVCSVAGKACFGLGVLYVLSKFCARIARVAYKPQGNLSPASMEDVQQRDSEGNCWAHQTVRKLPMSNKAKSSTPQELENNVLKNLFYAEVKANGRTLIANCMFLTTNLVVIPAHYFIDDHLDVEFYKDKSKSCGGKHSFKISKDASVRIGKTDLVLCYCASGGSMDYLLDYLPTEDLSSHQFHLVYRQKDGEVMRGNGLASYGVASNGVATFPGGEYSRLDIKTFDGLCGGVVITHGSGSMISGFHLGGESGTPKGCYGTLFLSDVLDAMSILSKLPGVLFPGHNGEGLNPQLLDKTILTKQELHKKSPANYLSDPSSLQYYGSCLGRKQATTTVKNTPISAAIEATCDAPNCYMPPKFKPEWWGEQLCLDNMGRPGTAFEFHLLGAAVRDYREHLFKKLNDYWRGMKPLTDRENFLGKDGVRFIDKLVEKTSMSILGLSPTAKSHYIEKEIDDDGNIERIEFTPEIKKLIDDAEALYAKGARAWTIAVANKKDEILSKEKCRMFFGNPVTLTWLIRKYFLPIARFLQMNPIASECAVGINAHGPEWEQFQSYVLKYGTDRILAGDYGKYDQKLSAQLLTAAFDILISIAEQCQYSERDLTIMRAMVSDVVYSLIAFNGDLYGITEGTHISGNSLTVVLNSVCGSLNLRCIFYKIYPFKNFDERVPFRDAVALGTYGDDNTGSVKEGFEKFNMVSVSEGLAEYGQEYTNPDKSKAKIEFLPLEQWEFLKRTNNYIPELDCHIGALLEKSIFKSLHCYMRGKSPALSQELACATNIDGALREWFAHGKDVYEKRRSEMKIVAQEIVNDVPVASLCRELDTTYEDRIEAWNAKYRPSD